MRGRKAGLKGLDEGGPRRELPIVSHPLKPCEGTTIHVEGNNGKSIVLRGSVVLKILIDFKHLPEKVSAIKLGNVEFHFVL